MSKIIITAAALLIPVSIAVAQAQESGATITGRIVDVNTGVPIAGSATVFMNYDGSLVTDTAIAGENGAFKLVLPTKPNRMLVWAESYAPKNIDNPGMTGAIALDPLQTLTVQIVDWNGAPVPNAPVYLRYGDAHGAYLPDWMVSGLEEQQFTTDSNGIFVVTGVIPNAPVFVQAEYLGASHWGDLLWTAPTAASHSEVDSQSEPAQPVTLVLAR
jgi:hypothetical protein